MMELGSCMELAAVYSIDVCGPKLVSHDYINRGKVSFTGVMSVTLNFQLQGEGIRM